ncbi:MAG: MFS transporter [Spirochaetes bacterium]|nr:MAG: MFS transporter [Spirochaetota bacterium]
MPDVILQKEKIKMPRNTRETGGRDFAAGDIHSHFILIIFALLYVVNYMDRQVLSVVQEAMKNDLGFSDTQVGTIQTVFLMSIAFFALPTAFVVDRWSRKKSIGIMAVGWSLFTCLTGIGKTYLGVLMPRMFVGVGEAGFASGGTAMITAAYNKKYHGKVMGIFNMAIPTGSALGVVLGGYISVQSGSWRTPFIIFAIPGIILGIASFFMKDYRTYSNSDIPGGKKNLMQSARALFKIRSLRWLYIGYAMMQIMTFSFFVWGPSYIMRCYGCREDKAGMLMGIVGMMAIIGALLGGVLSDKWQLKNQKARLLMPAICSSAASLLLMTSYALNVKGIGYISAVMFGIIAMMSIPALSAATQEVVPPDLKSLSWGMNVLLQYVLGGGWAPIAIGLISDSLGSGLAGLRIALVITAAGGILAGVCFWVGAKSFPSDSARVKEMVIVSE